MQTKGTFRSMSPMGVAVAYAIGLAAALVPALASIYNPHQYASDPLLEPVAVRNVLIAVCIAVPLAWLFGRKWSRRVVNRLSLGGVALTLLSLVFLVVASSRPMRSAGLWLTLAVVCATLAIPCCALLTHAITKQGEAE